MNREGSGRGQTNSVCHNRTNLRNLKKNWKFLSLRRDFPKRISETN
jgi:hypothetical protein